jgi:hypothetical protein
MEGFKRKHKMKKRKLLELESVDSEVLEERITDEEKNEKELDVRVKFGHADRINANRRLYPRAVLQREIDKVNERIRNGRTVWGMAFHPSDRESFGKTTDVTHQWKRVWMEKDGSAMGELTLLPTEPGKSLQVLVKRGRLGISSRGFGNTVEKTKTVNGKEVKYFEVADDYRMETPGDWVMAPSVKDAGNVREQLVLLESQLNKADEDSKTKKEKTMKKEKKGPVVFTADKVHHEARALGIDPKKYAEQLNEIERKKAEVKAKEEELGLTREQADEIYRAAHLAGKKISAENKIEILESWQKPLPSQQLTREEALKEADKNERIREGQKKAFFARERQVAGAPRKVNLERRVEILTEKLNDLVSRFDRALSGDDEENE